ncbi:kinase-like domain-containing protein, partial [Pavlovales sp. CCMP2436]
MAGTQARRQVRVGVYNIDEMIGAGSFAKVFRGQHRVSRQVVAVKAISRARLNKKLMENLESEISILKALEHPNIVCLHDIQVTERHIYLILEYCAGGDLTHVLRTHGPISEWRAQQYLAQLADGLSALRRHNLVHRDLKPHNLLLASPEHPRPLPMADGSMPPEPPVPLLKIADFGFAREISPHSMAETLCGSPLYMAPEILLYQRYDAKADLWSVGAILVELLTGAPPFKGQNHIELLRHIQTTEPPLPVFDRDGRRCGEECQALLGGLLRRNP